MYLARRVHPTALKSDLKFVLNLVHCRDGDMDVLCASFHDNAVRYFESSGGASPTFTARTVTTLAVGATSVFGAGMQCSPTIRRAPPTVL